MPATYVPTTSVTDVNGVWRKVQAPLQLAAQFAVDEWDMLDDIPELQVDLSAREITLPLDFNDDVGIASIPEGGWEARPSSPNVVDGTLTWILLNGRFTISRTAQMLDRSARGRAAMIARQLLYQARKKVEAFRRRVGDYFYGFSTAVVAKVAAVAGDVVTLKDLYGVAGLGAAGESRLVTDPFKAGEFIAGLNPVGPVIRSITSVVSVDSANLQITVAAGGAATWVADDLIVFANSLENDPANLSSTDHNKGLVGLLDMFTSTSVHGVSGATNPKWNAVTDATGGRLTGARLRRSAQEINNNGGGQMNQVLWSQGVENDVVALLQAGLRFTDSFQMELDGSPKFRGVRLMSTRFVPGQHAFCSDRRSIRKFSLVPKPDQGVAWGDAHKLQDQSGFVIPLDFGVALIVTNRGNLKMFSGLTEQL